MLCSRSQDCVGPKKKKNGLCLVREKEQKCTKLEKSSIINHQANGVTVSDLSGVAKVYMDIRHFVRLLLRRELCNGVTGEHSLSVELQEQIQLLKLGPNTGYRIK